MRSIVFLLAAFLCFTVNHSAFAATQTAEVPYEFQAVSADTAVKAGRGVLHTLTCQSDAAATAGSIILYDSLTETGTKIFDWTVSVVEYQPRTLVFDAEFKTGLYIGYTTTADVNCTVTYR